MVERGLRPTRRGASKSGALVTLGVALVAGACRRGLAEAGVAPSEQSRERVIARMVGRWRGIFGPVDFAAEDMFQVMLYVGARPADSLRPMGRRKLSPTITELHSRWLRAFVQPRLLPRTQGLGPSSFYLGSTSEKGPDLLEYRWRAESARLRLLENTSMMLLSIQPDGAQPEKGIAAQDLARLLTGTFRLPYASAAEASGAFHLPGRLEVGDVFTNVPSRELKGMYPQRVVNWRRHVVGFVGADGINVICFKQPNTGGAWGGGFVPTPHWLAGHLLQSDGKTPIEREAAP